MRRRICSINWTFCISLFLFLPCELGETVHWHQYETFGCQVFRLVRKKIVIRWVVRHWHRFPREAVSAPALGAFKAGQGLEQPAVVELGPCPWEGRGGTRWSLTSLLTKTIQWFYDKYSDLCFYFVFWHVLLYRQNQVLQIDAQLLIVHVVRAWQTWLLINYMGSWIWTWILAF